MQNHLSLRSGWSGALLLWSLVLAAVVGAASAAPRPVNAVRNRTSGSATDASWASAAGVDAAASKPIVSPIAGKGMWIYEFHKIAGGNPRSVAYYAKQGRLTHIFVRVGSGKAGLATLAQVGRVLPYAHRYGIKVIAWYFPYYSPVQEDIDNSITTINYRNKGESFDGFAADIEFAPGANLTSRTVRQYSEALRAQAPQAYLVAVPPRPTKDMQRLFPYSAMMPSYDAVAPMVYWGRYDPSATTQAAIDYLSRWGKPVAPIGQMYDMAPEGGPKGNPSTVETYAFMRTSKQSSAIGISFWSWQDATSREWHTLREFPW